MPTTSARWPAEVTRRDIFSSSQAPSVSSSRTSAISTFTVLARSSCAVTAFESVSSVVTLAAVHDRPGLTQAHRLMAWPSTGVRSARSVSSSMGTLVCLSPGRCTHVDLPQATLRVPCAAVDSKHEFHVANAVLDGIGLHLETEVAAHRQHHGVFGKHIPRDDLESFGFGIFDDQLHQRPTESPALEIGSEQDRVFTVLVNRIRVNPDHANDLVGGFVQRH